MAWLNKKFDDELKAGIEQLKTDSVYKRLNYLDSPQSARVHDGRPRRSAHLLIEQLPRPVRRALGRAARASKVWSDSAPERGASASSAERSRSIAISRKRSRSSSEPRLRFPMCPHGMRTRASLRRSSKQGDFVVSDALNHASIIDSLRLAKAITKCTTAVYAHSDMADLDAKLETARDAKRRIIWTDGVFSMEGSIAKLPDILEIARKHDAIVAVDDSHGTGVLGANGRGTAEHFGVVGEVDVITSTLGKALGGAAGGFVAGPASLCDMLTQTIATTAVFECASADGRGERARFDRIPERAPGARQEAAGQRALFPGADRRGGIQAAARRDPDRAHYCGRNGYRHPNE